MLGSYKGDAAINIPFNKKVVIRKGFNNIPLGVSLKLKSNEAAFVLVRSSWSNIIMANVVPIDSGYTGEIHALFYSDKDLFINEGVSIFQYIIVKIKKPKCSKLIRGLKAFGSSERR